MTNQKFELGPLQKEWLQRLRAHPERQGRIRLGKKNSDGTYTACVMGEAGLMLGTCEFDEEGILREKESDSEFILKLSYCKIGLLSYTGSPLIDYFTTRDLAYLNDHGKTWLEIADIIEANPANYFREPK